MWKQISYKAATLLERNFANLIINLHTIFYCVSMASVSVVLKSLFSALINPIRDCVTETRVCGCNRAGKHKHGMKACDVGTGCLPKVHANSRVQRNNNNRKHIPIEIHGCFSETYLQKVPDAHGVQEVELWCGEKKPEISRQEGNQLFWFILKYEAILWFVVLFAII